MGKVKLQRDTKKQRPQGREESRQVRSPQAWDEEDSWLRAETVSLSVLEVLIHLSFADCFPIVTTCNTSQRKVNIGQLGFSPTSAPPRSDALK